MCTVKDQPMWDHEKIKMKHFLSVTAFRGRRGMCLGNQKRMGRKIVVVCVFFVATYGKDWGSIHSAFFFLLFFGVAQAFERRFCSGICYFSVFLHPIMLLFWGSNMLRRGDYAPEICYFVVVHASPFPLQSVCIIYFLFPAYLLWQLATSHFSFTAFTMLCSTHVCMHVCMCVKYTFVYIPHRDIYRTLCWGW